MLQKIKLKNFRKFADAEIDFTSGITLINGANGVGKSTILEAIEWGFYNKTKKDTVLVSIRNKNHPEEEVQVTLFFSFNGQNYKLDRILTAKNSTTATIVDANNEETIYAKGTTGVNEFITKLFGIGHQAFTTSFMAKQKEIDSLGSFKNEERKQFFIKLLGLEVLDKIKPEIRRDIRGSKETLNVLRGQLPNIPKIIEELKEDEKTKKELEKQHTKLEQEIAKIQNELQQLTIEKEKSDENYKKYLQLSEQLNSVALNIQQTKNNIKNNQKLIEELTSAELKEVNLDDINKEIDILESERDGFRRMAQFEDRFRELRITKKALQQDIDYKLAQKVKLENDLPQEISDIKELEQQYQQKNNQLLQLKAKVQLTQEQLNEIDNLLYNIEKGIISQCPTCYSDFSGSTEALEHIKQEWKQHKKSILSLEFKISGTKKELEILEQEITKKQNYKKIADEIQGKINTNVALTQSLIKQQEDIDKQIVNIQEKTGEINVSSYKNKTLHETEMALQSFKSAKERGIKIIEQLNNLKYKKEDAEKLSLLLIEQSAQKELVSDTLKELKFNENKHNKLITSIKEISDTFAATKERKMQYESDIRIIDNNIINKNNELVKAKAVEKEVNEYRIKIETSTLVEEIMTELRLDLAGRIAPKIGEYTSNFLREITDGLYQNVLLDENYNIKVLVDDEEWPLSQLSGGEQDVINLCMRLAISQIILESKGIPYNMIILDEIFGSQDDERKMAIIDVIGKLKTIFPQIVLITHINEVKDKADNIISIEKLSNGDSVIVD